jgi:predicted Fe-Mo cluster-binding NifX family protein
MKIAISSSGKTLDSDVDPRFGRCKNFLIVNIETKKIEPVENTSIYSAHGAGIGAAQKVASLNVDAVITGHVGPNAHNALHKTGIKIYTGAEGTIKEAIAKYNQNQLKETTSPTVTGHYGKRRNRR